MGMLEPAANVKMRCSRAAGSTSLKAGWFGRLWPESLATVDSGDAGVFAGARGEPGALLRSVLRLLERVRGGKFGMLETVVPRTRARFLSSRCAKLAEVRSGGQCMLGRKKRMVLEVHTNYCELTVLCGRVLALLWIHFQFEVVKA